jgi:hypothetical protein
MKKISKPLLISLCCSAPLVAETYDAQKLNRLGNSRNYETKPKFSQMIQALRRQTNVEIGEDELEKPWAPLEDPISPSKIQIKKASEVSPHHGPNKIAIPDLSSEEEAKAVDLYRKPITRKEAFQPTKPLEERVKGEEPTKKAKSSSFLDRFSFFSSDEPESNQKNESKEKLTSKKETSSKKTVAKEKAKQNNSGPDLLKVFKSFSFKSDESKTDVEAEKPTKSTSQKPRFNVIKNLILGDPDEETSDKKIKVEVNEQAKEDQERKAYLKLQIQKKEAEKSEMKAKRETEMKAKQKAEMKAKQEAEMKAKQEAEMKAKQEAEMKAKQEAEMKAKQEAEMKAKQEAEMKAKQEAEMKAKREAKMRAEVEKKHMAKLEAEKQAIIEADKKAKKNMLPANPEYIRRYKKNLENKSKNDDPKQSRRQKKEGQDNITSPIQRIIY